MHLTLWTLQFNAIYEVHRNLAKSQIKNKEAKIHYKEPEARKLRVARSFDRAGIAQLQVPKRFLFPEAN